MCRALACFSIFDSSTLSREVVGLSVMWLAVLIVRGAVERDLRAILDRIRCEGVLGMEMNTVALDHVIQKGDRGWIRSDRNAAEGGRMENGCEMMVAFWLPDGLGEELSSAEIMKVCKNWEEKVFRPVEDLFLGYIGYEKELPLSLGNARIVKDGAVSLSPELEKRLEGLVWSMENAHEEDKL